MYTAFINYIVMIIMITILYHASAESSICNALMWAYGRTVAYISSFFFQKKNFLASQSIDFNRESNNGRQK